MVFLRYVILFTALQSLTLAWKMDREVGSDEPTRWYRLESQIRDSCFNPISSRDCGFIASFEMTWDLGPGPWSLGPSLLQSEQVWGLFNFPFLLTSLSLFNFP